MFELRIGQSTDVTINHHIQPLLEGLNKIRERKVRVYYTFVDSLNPKTKFAFVTTSKDTHLGIGMMDADTRRHLAWFLSVEFSKRYLDHERECHQLLLTFETGDNSERPILVTWTIDKGVKEENIPVLETFTFSPA